MFDCCLRLTAAFSRAKRTFYQYLPIRHLRILYVHGAHTFCKQNVCAYGIFFARVAAGIYNTHEHLNMYTNVRVYIIIFCVVLFFFFCPADEKIWRFNLLSRGGPIKTVYACLSRRSLNQIIIIV